MKISFIPNESPDDDNLFEVHIESVPHGFIRGFESGGFGYFKIIGNKMVPRHESESLDELKRMVVERV